MSKNCGCVCHTTDAQPHPNERCECKPDGTGIARLTLPPDVNVKRAKNFLRELDHRAHRVATRTKNDKVRRRRTNRSNH